MKLKVSKFTKNNNDFLVFCQKNFNKLFLTALKITFLDEFNISYITCVHKFSLELRHTRACGFFSLWPLLISIILHGIISN